METEFEVIQLLVHSAFHTFSRANVVKDEHGHEREKTRCRHLRNVLTPRNAGVLTD
jgi:hypothetical protein